MHEEVAELKAVAANHPELPENGLDREPEQAITHMTDIVDRARTAVTERAELPGMSLLEHLEELRKRIIHSGVYLIVAFFVAYSIREKLAAIMEKPIVEALKAHNLDPHLVYLNPVDPFNFFIKISLVCGAIMASPFILFQVWLFIAPGLYRQEKRYILPFMTATVDCFWPAPFSAITTFIPAL